MMILLFNCTSFGNPMANTAKYHAVDVPTWQFDKEQKPEFRFPYGIHADQRRRFFQ
jgi:hypothetical protein